jgi:hypothetical protein
MEKKVLLSSVLTSAAWLQVCDYSVRYEKGVMATRGCEAAENTLKQSSVCGLSVCVCVCVCVCVRSITALS